MLMWEYSFNRNKITRSFILISFIFNLEIKNKYNILPEIHLASSGSIQCKHKININKLFKMKSKQAVH